MIRVRSFSLLVLIGLALLLGGCFVPTAGGQLDIQTAFTLEIDQTTYEYDATLDFGVVNPDGDPITVAGDVLNTLAVDVVVTDISLDSTVFSATTPTLPLTVVAGESIAVSLSFGPTTSGVATVVLSVTVEGVEEAFILNLTGEGNYPPMAYEAVVVTGAGTSLANGAYLRDGNLNEVFADPPIPLPYYENPDNGYRIYGEEVEGVWWVLDASTDASDILYEMQYASPIAPSTVVASGLEWAVQSGNNGIGPAPVSVGPLTLDYPGNPFWGDIITGSYWYSDAEGDPESGTTVQWYRSDTSDPAGTYSAIVGATNATYTTTSADENRFLKFEVAPRSSSGTQQGEVILLGPSPPFASPG